MLNIQLHILDLIDLKYFRQAQLRPFISQTQKT